MFKGRTMKAFPITEANLIHVNSESCAGMDLRDYFAAKAMQAFVAKSDNNVIAEYEIAEWAYWVADAMLIRRKISED